MAGTNAVTKPRGHVQSRRGPQEPLPLTLEDGGQEVTFE